MDGVAVVAARRGGSATYGAPLHRSHPSADAGPIPRRLSRG